MSYGPGSMLERFLKLRGWFFVKFLSNSMAWGPSYGQNSILEPFYEFVIRFSLYNSYFLRWYIYIYKPTNSLCAALLLPGAASTRGAAWGPAGGAAKCPSSHVSVSSPNGWSLWRKSKPPAALLSVSGHPETVPPRGPGPIPRESLLVRH